MTEITLLIGMSLVTLQMNCEFYLKSKKLLQVICTPNKTRNERHIIEKWELTGPRVTLHLRFTDRVPLLPIDTSPAILGFFTSKSARSTSIERRFSYLFRYETSALNESLRHDPKQSHESILRRAGR
jgi:uncharacterized membrane protein